MEKTRNRKINWEMLLSHHPPCQLDRTLRIGRVHVCVRCLAVFSAFALAFVWNFVSVVAPWFALLLLLSAPVPAVLNFTLTEMRKIRNRNLYRFLTGALLGYGLGCSFISLMQGDWLHGILPIAWTAALEFVVVVVLDRAGVLRSYIKEYEEGVYK